MCAALVLIQTDIHGQQGRALNTQMGTNTSASFFMYGWGRTRQRSPSELQRGVNTPSVSVEYFSRGGLPTPDCNTNAS
jgi:hypothetical protein